MGLTQIPVDIISFPFVQRYGRKSSIIISDVLGGVLLFVSAFLPRTTTRRGGDKAAAAAARHAEEERTCKEHSFLTDVSDVRKMEQGLLSLLNDFHSGRMQAFGEDCSFEKMDQVREQQERLAKLHFDLDTELETLGMETPKARSVANENLTKLVTDLQELSHSIQGLHSKEPVTAAAAAAAAVTIQHHPQDEARSERKHHRHHHGHRSSHRTKEAK
ncbi:PREDICTED: coiled-coil domain-containing protein 28B-like [Priapulus caudatus]|uniref:Coiled-coil domain-containing protein 28B-like n=1 Tax=Priapulus caudatus TaxID=37621 RepID=A0ABM1EC22_PRICU|nr:PREDICTED: coiled-coil domain-containing protein 28B-like [Priapulus caudatus]